jgi:hypothetical protein
MKGRDALRILFAGLSLAPLGSCGSQPGEFVIVQNQVPQEGCVITGDRGHLYRGEGRLDVSLVGDESAVGYRIYPLIQNNKRQLARDVEPNRTFVHGFRVEVELDEGPAAVAGAFAAPWTSYEERWAGTVDPGGGLLPAAVTGIPGELARKIRATKALETTTFMRVFATVTALGKTTEGEPVESDSFRFPIRVCQGCLVASVQACPAAPRAMGHECNIAQDVAVDCCLADNRLVCPSIPPASK